MDYQKKIKKGYVKSRNKYTKSAPKRKGSAPYTVDPPNTRSKSAPVGFGGALEEEIDVDINGFSPNKELEPQLWYKDNLRKPISKRLMRIAKDFVDELPFDVEVKDVRLTGSLANYNWSKHSDVDLHIVVDFSEVDENKELVKELFNSKRLIWNENHNIKIKGYDVEVYVEDEGEEHHSTGIYSIMRDEWIEHPKQVTRAVDIETAKKKAEDIEQQIDSINALFDQGDFEKVIKHVDRIKNKIRSMRKAGLESEEMEFSPENIAFKIMRRSDLLDILTRLKYRAYDQSMTLDH
jgi:predicted nucleotidyltransferase